MALPTTQQQHVLIRESGRFTLDLDSAAPVRAPREHEVVVQVKATSLNRRDVMIARGLYGGALADRLVPLSDGAGEVIAVGSRVGRFKVGDRVAATFFQNWAAGRPTATTGESALGGARHGMLATYVTLSDEGLVALPEHLSFEEGACLPCAAVTAWVGLTRCGRMQAGDNVLLQGTGGVSVFGLQFAVAAGAKPIITSAHELKLEHARRLGAVHGINYRLEPEWDQVVRRLTHGIGAHQILEVGGEGTLARSLAALAPGGHVAIIGGLAGFGGNINAASLIGRNASVTGVFVGSRADFEEMNAFVSRHRIRPVIDRVFPFARAADAYAYMDSGSHFGKVVIAH